MQAMIRNKVTEKDIRDWLDKNGYLGRTAKLIELELHAIKRPGWLQIFRFHFKAQTLNQPLSQEAGEDEEETVDKWNELFGVVRDDERETNRLKGTQISVFETEEQQSDKLEELSAGLITLGGESANLLWLIVGFGAVLAIAILVANLLG